MPGPVSLVRIASNSVPIPVELIFVRSDHRHSTHVGGSVAASAYAIDVSCDGNTGSFVAGMTAGRR